MTFWIGPRKAERPGRECVAEWDGEDPSDAVPMIRDAVLFAAGIPEQWRYGGKHHRCVASGEVTVCVVREMVRCGMVPAGAISLRVWDRERGRWATIGLGKDGCPLDPWPGGFYPWRDDLLRDGLQRWER